MLAPHLVCQGFTWSPLVDFNKMHYNCLYVVRKERKSISFKLFQGTEGSVTVLHSARLPTDKALGGKWGPGESWPGWVW